MSQKYCTLFSFILSSFSLKDLHLCASPPIHFTWLLAKSRLPLLIAYCFAIVFRFTIRQTDKWGHPFLVTFHRGSRVSSIVLFMQYTPKWGQTKRKSIISLAQRNGPIRLWITAFLVLLQSSLSFFSVILTVCTVHAESYLSTCMHAMAFFFLFRTCPKISRVLSPIQSVLLPITYRSKREGEERKKGTFVWLAGLVGWLDWAHPRFYYDTVQQSCTIHLVKYKRAEIL